MRIGVLSDTHNLLRDEVITALNGCDAILHGGDISSQKVLNQLMELAPLYVVRGNNDKAWAEQIPMYLDFWLAGVHVYMTHKKKDLPEDLSAYDLVVYGHSHKYEESRQGRTLLLNPGSCGPRRFHQAITLAILEITDGEITVERIEIPHPEPAVKASGGNIKQTIETVIREIDKGRSIGEIASRHGLNPDLTEQIARLYVTHPGVTADGIMTKMGM
ncbi:MAG: metallophosphoesterase family protein [Oscillospiraceae bacterium]|nr:metallophosphoesterase family protein [Oscillospiraceae bacterium]